MLDPVCVMVVDPQQFLAHCLGMQVAFRSLQCQQRFVANLHLYVGFPGVNAPQQ